MGFLGPKLQWQEPWYFVVSATTKRGTPFERRIKMPAKDVTEQDVVKFFFDMELSHLLDSTSRPDTSRPDAGGQSENIV